MMPRFVMPDFMDTLALFTFNGWALDGFLKVFWYDDPAAGIARSLLSLAPQLAVLHGHESAVWCVMFSPDGTRLASGGGFQEGRNCTIKLWETGD